jgi:hypothetical protein
VQSSGSSSLYASSISAGPFLFTATLDAAPYTGMMDDGCSCMAHHKLALPTILFSKPSMTIDVQLSTIKSVASLVQRVWIIY